MLSLQEQVVLSFKTLLEMLEDRGVATDALSAISPKELDALSATQNVFTLRVNDGLSVVYYLNKMKVSEFKVVLLGKKQDPAATEAATAGSHIFVFKDELSTQNAKALAALYPRHQAFHIKELLYNVSKHSLVPKHEVVSGPGEVEAIMKRFNIKNKSMFPLIQSTDAMAKYLGLAPGDLVRITRPSPTAGSYTYFRVCVQ